MVKHILIATICCFCLLGNAEGYQNRQRSDTGKSCPSTTTKEITVTHEIKAGVGASSTEFGGRATRTERWCEPRKIQDRLPASSNSSSKSNRLHSRTGGGDGW